MKRKIYFVPHQDDELLTFGIDIALSVKEGFEVFVVLCTDGGGSRIRNILNDKSECSICHSLHAYPLSVDEFIKARDREIISSCASLGVKKENLIIEERRIADGSLDEERAKELIKKYLDYFGKDSFVSTMYPNDESVQHRDHRRLGLAALSLKNEGIIKHLSLDEEPYVYKKVTHSPDSEPERITASGEISKIIDEAIKAYSLFDPSQGRYAIGFHSVNKEMLLLKEEKTLYRHNY
ncbi:MAG: PIG-L family deacetylase [Ruminococcaceae bacterium]|nr:PIG-L family deacetylase [Oscillospiraceae bacterium]